MRRFYQNSIVQIEVKFLFLKVEIHQIVKCVTPMGFKLLLRQPMLQYRSSLRDY